MDILVFLIFGALVGWLSSVLMKTNDNQGLLGDIVLGVLGALAGGLIMRLLDMPGYTGFNIYSLVVATIGAVILVAVGRAFKSAGR